MNQAVFQHFRDLRYSSAHVCSEITGASISEVTDTMREMKRLGHLQEVSGCAELYLYITGFPGREKARKKPKPSLPVPELQKKLWWAMSMPMNCPGVFSAFAIAQLAGCSEEYAKRYIAGLLYRKIVAVFNRALGWPQYRVTGNAPPADQPPRVNIQLGG